MTDTQIADAYRLLAETRPTAVAVVMFTDDGAVVRVFGGDEAGELRRTAGLALLHGPQDEAAD